MKTTATATAIAALVAGSLPLFAADESARIVPGFEPLSLTISKFKRGPFGKGVNPLQMMDMNATSGVNLTAKVTLAEGWAERIVPEACKLDHFTDDQKTDLLPSAGNEIDPFWENNRSFSVVASREKDSFGILVRGVNVPAAGACKLHIDGELAFASEGAGKEARHEELELRHEQVVEMEPVRLRFTQAKPRSGQADGEEQSMWYVQVLPGEGVSKVKVVLFGKDKDVPILGGNNAETRTFNVSRKPGGGSPFHGITMQGFSCPGGKLSRIVVRYVSSGDLVRIPFQWETGLGMEETHAPAR